MGAVGYKGILVAKCRHDNIENAEQEMYEIDYNEGKSLKTLDELRRALVAKFREDNKSYNLLHTFKYRINQNSIDPFDVFYTGKALAVKICKNDYNNYRARSKYHNVKDVLINEIWYNNAPVQYLTLDNKNVLFHEFNFTFKNYSSVDINSIDVKLTLLDDFGNIKGVEYKNFENDYYDTENRTWTNCYSHLSEDIAYIICEIIRANGDDQVFEYDNYEKILIDRHSMMKDIMDEKQFEYLLKAKSIDVKISDIKNWRELFKVPKVSGQYVTDLYGNVYLAKDRQDLVEIENYCEKQLFDDYDQEIKNNKPKEEYKPKEEIEPMTNTQQMIVYFIFLILIIMILML